MNRNTKKRTAIVVAVAGGAMAMGGVYATLLSVTANQAAGGSVNVGSCDTDLEVKASDPVYSTGGWYVVETLTVSAIPTGGVCVGQNFHLANASGDAAPVFNYTDALEEGDLDADAPFSAVNWSYGDGKIVLTFANGGMPAASLGSIYAVAIQEPTAN